MSNQDYMNDYLEESGRTAALPDETTVREDVFKHHVDLAYDMVMFVEAGCNADLVKRSLFYKEALDKTRARGLKHQLDNKELYDKLKVLQLTKPEQIKFTPQQIDMIHAALGLFSEAGEIVEEVIKSATENREMDLTNLEEEGGDVMWYIALYLRSIKSSFIKVTKQNIAKLFKRYPEKFNSDSALIRDLKAEREVLEKHTA